MKNNTGTVHSVDFWREHADQAHENLLEGLEKGTFVGGTQGWDRNWINICLALERFKALEIILDQHGVDPNLSLKERIGCLVLLGDGDE